MTIGPEIFFVIGTVLLGIVIAAVFVFVRGRNKANDAITEAAAHELKRHPDRYEDHTKQELEAQVRR